MGITEGHTGTSRTQGHKGTQEDTGGHKGTQETPEAPELIASQRNGSHLNAVITNGLDYKKGEEVLYSITNSTTGKYCSVAFI